MDDQPKFSRLALAAALIEYDNDPQDRWGDNVDHRKSAMFRSVYNRPPRIRGPDVVSGGPLMGMNQEQDDRSSLDSARNRPPGAPVSPTGAPSPGTPVPYTGGGDWVDGEYEPHAHLRAPGAKAAPAQLAMSGPYPIVAPLTQRRTESGDFGGQQRRTASGDFGGQQRRTASSDFNSFNSEQRRTPSGDMTMERSSRWMPDLAPRDPGVNLGALPDVRHSVAVSHARVASSSALSETGVVLEGVSSSSIHLDAERADEEEGSGEGDEREGGLNADADQRYDARPGSFAVDDGSSVMMPMREPMRDSTSRLANSRPGSAGPHRMSMKFSEEELLRNPFEIPAPPTEFSSRFDPKATPSRRSLDLDAQSQAHSQAPNPRRVPRSERRRSLDDSYYDDFGESIHEPERPQYSDIPDAGDYGRPLRPPKYGHGAARVSSRELLRPKTLIMPSQLAGTERPVGTVHIPEGFMLGEKPLPADARASILNMGVGVPLSLAQRTFRSSLMVGGRREEDEYFQGQAEEGEMCGALDEEEHERLPGKLYGTSLIDQLEARKKQIHNKKRVFYGDNRPSMMARKSMFLESPNEEQTETVPDGLSPPTADITARPLTTVGMPTAGGETARDRAAKSRSVFGVDTVWEREMEKLRAIQEAEKKATDAATMERLARERERVEKRQSRWLKTRSMALPDTTAPQFELPNPNRMSVGIPDLAAGPGEKRITMFGDNRKSMMFAGDNAVNEEDEDAENDKEGEADADGEGEGEAADSDLKRPPTIFKEAGAPASPLGGVDKWFGSSDGSDSEGDEDNVPLSSVRGSVFGSIRGVSPNPNLNPTKKVVPPQPRLPAVAMSDDGSSDEDVPLSKVKELVHDSDEEVPLSKLRTSGGNPVRSKKTTPVSASGPKLDTDFGTDLEKTFANIGAEADKAAASPATPVIDEDDLPLFMRRQKAHEQRKKEQTAEEIEDDLPLAWKHAGAAQKQASQRQPQAQSMMYGPYMSGYGMPGMPMGGMGMGGMGMNGMGMGGGMPGPMGGHMSMMAPQMNMNMGYPADVPAPDPGSNIDNWRKQVGTSSRG